MIDSPRSEQASRLYLRLRHSKLEVVRRGLLSDVKSDLMLLVHCSLFNEYSTQIFQARNAVASVCTAFLLVPNLSLSCISVDFLFLPSLPVHNRILPFFAFRLGTVPFPSTADRFS